VVEEKTGNGSVVKYTFKLDFPDVTKVEPRDFLYYARDGIVTFSLPIQRSRRTEETLPLKAISILKVLVSTPINYSGNG